MKFKCLQSIEIAQLHFIALERTMARPMKKMALIKLCGEPSFATRMEIRPVRASYCFTYLKQFEASLANLRFTARFLADFFTALIFWFFCIKAKERETKGTSQCFAK